ncbi:MAG: bifunctional diguanylate cyclase/phosphodiesterase [Dokdonella sp.]
MSDGLIMQLVLLGLGSLIALTQSGIFAHYYGLFRREHLRFWSMSFLASAVYLACSALSIGVVNELPTSHWLRVTISSVSLVAAYVQVVLMVMGTLAIWRTRSWSGAQIGSAVAAALVLGLVSGLAYAFDPVFVQERFFLRVGLRHLIAGAAALAMGVAIARRWPDARFGQQLTAIALTAYGFYLLLVFTAYAMQASGGSILPWMRQIAPVGLIPPMFIGYGLVVWLLEDERERAELATDAAARLRHFDAMTGLPNRQYMLEHLGRQMETMPSAALLLIRIDNLGHIAAAFGMDGVDLALASSAERIAEVARTGGMFAARPDADHFALLGSGVGAEAGSGRLAEQLLDSLSRPLFWNGREIALEASIGIAIAPGDASTADALQSRAEMARARARREGAMRYRFYAPDLEAELQQRIMLQSELRTAFAREEFVLEFQPILDGWSLEVTCFEALVRWNHPERGRLLPDQFIDELEPLGMIEALDAWVLERACVAALTWQTSGRDPIPVAVNISAYSFQRRDFPDTINTLLQRTGLDAVCLELEIIESIALELPERAMVSLDSLRELGVRVMLDDFGTGFSSLKHLRQLPFDGIKIDRSFVVDVLIDPRDAAIVRAMLALAHSLGLEVVAEGIETAAQLAWFQSAGCDRLQGFHFHRSMELDAAVALVRHSAVGNGKTHAIR